MSNETKKTETKLAGPIHDPAMDMAVRTERNATLIATRDCVEKIRELAKATLAEIEKHIPDAEKYRLIFGRVAPFVVFKQLFLIKTLILEILLKVFVTH